MYCDTRECDKSPTTISDNSKNTSSTQELKSKECPATLECDKFASKVSNNSKNTSYTPKSNTNESTATLEYDKFASKVSNNCDISSSNTKSKSNNCTVSQECDKFSSTPKLKSDEYTSSDFLESPKDEAYEYMKTHFFTFLKNKIPFGRDVLDKIHYYPFVQDDKKQFIMKYCKEHKISYQKL